MNLTENIPLFYIIIFSVTLVFSILVNALFIRFAQNLGIRKNQGVQIRWSSTAKPAFGGISFYLTFLTTFIILELVLKQEITEGLSDRKLLGVLFTTTIAFLMGLADDAFDTKPLLKFLVQFLCAIVLIIVGIRIHTFESEFLNYVLTILWVVGIMNSINMLDNMDAIATVVSIVILTFILFLNLQTHNALNPQSVLVLGLIGTLCGFLVFNWHPSQMFMGDTGSQFLGIFLATVGIEFCWNNPSLKINNEFSGAIQIVIIVALVYMITLTDTAVVFIKRIMEGRSPFVGGKDHTTHHLFFRGITEKRIAILFIGLNVLSCYLAWKLMRVDSANYIAIFLYGLFPLAYFVTMLLICRKR